MNTALVGVGVTVLVGVFVGAILLVGVGVGVLVVPTEGVIEGVTAILRVGDIDGVFVTDGVTVGVGVRV